MIHLPQEHEDRIRALADERGETPSDYLCLLIEEAWDVSEIGRRLARSGEEQPECEPSPK